MFHQTNGEKIMVADFNYEFEIFQSLFIEAEVTDIPNPCLVSDKYYFKEGQRFPIKLFNSNHFDPRKYRKEPFFPYYGIDRLIEFIKFYIYSEVYTSTSFRLMSLTHVDEIKLSDFKINSELFTRMPRPECLSTYLEQKYPRLNVKKTMNLIDSIVTRLQLEGRDGELLEFDISTELTYVVSLGNIYKIRAHDFLELLDRNLLC